jgi:predicted nucleic acid-binding protein
MVFIDTSAFFAVLDAEDANHTVAKAAWIELIEQDEPLICTNYVLLETIALVQHRLGMSALRAFEDDIVPLILVHWIDEPLHRLGVAAVLMANQQLSLVDGLSFEVARRRGISRVLAFDRHFAEQGFTCLG